MAKTQTNQTRTLTQVTPNGTVEVLYQKMGDRWFAFSCVGEDVFVGSITQEELQVAETTSANLTGKTHTLTGNT
jgi:hypothetical protein